MKLNVIAVKDGAPWYGEGLRFSCTQCGNCCTGGPGYVWISQEEIGRLAAHLNIPMVDVIDQYCRRLGGRYSLKERRTPQGQYDCIFLREERVAGEGGDGVAHTRRSCEIYPVRPLQCRTWPFWDGLLESRENWDRAAQRCPGMGRGRTYSRDQVEALRHADDWPAT